MIYEIGTGTGVYCIQGAGPRVYYIARPQPMLVDTGAPGQVGIILRALASLAVQPIAIKKIILTHHHPGHVGGAEELKRITGAVLYSHLADMPFIRGRLKRRSPRNPFERVLNSATWSALMEATPVWVDKYVGEDDEINGWRIIHTPGHTPGHICLLRDKMLISGDLLQVSGGGFREMSLSAISNVPASRASIAKIAALDFDAILSGHSEPYVIGAGNKVKELAERLTGPVQ